MTQEIFARCGSCGTLNKAPLMRAGMAGKCGQCGAAINFPAPQAPVSVTDSSFDSYVGAAAEPVLLEFWSPTCGHCIRMEPVLEQVARELTGRVRVAKLDTSVNSRVPSIYGISGTPSFVLLRRGKEQARAVGAMPKEELIKRFSQYI